MNAKGGGGGRRSGSQSPGPAAAAILCQAPAGAAAARPPRAAASHALPAAPQWRRPPSLPPSLPPFSPPPREGAGARTHLRQSEEDAGRLDELAAQDAQVGLALQVQAVLHGGSRREALLGDERVVDGERYLRVQPVTDKDTRGGGSRRGGDGSGGGGGGDGGGGSGSNGGGGGGGRVCGGGSHDGGARPHPQPATHRLARPGAVTQHTAAPARAARREKKVRRAPPRSPTIDRRCPGGTGEPGTGTGRRCPAPLQGERRGGRTRSRPHRWGPSAGVAPGRGSSPVRRSPLASEGGKEDTRGGPVASRGEGGGWHDSLFLQRFPLQKVLNSENRHPALYASRAAKEKEIALVKLCFKNRIG